MVAPDLDSRGERLAGEDPRGAPARRFSFAASLRNLKKALVGSSAQESTENRATAAAVVPDTPAAPFVHVQPPAAANKPYVISPATADRPPSTPPMAAPHTTTPGMPAPSMGASLAQAAAALGPTATSPQSVDRRAPTHSYVPDVLPAPRADTQAGHAGSGSEATLASNAPPPVAAVDFRWPPEQAPARSEEPQVRTLSGPMPTVPRSAAPVVAAVVLMIGLALASVALVVLRLRTSSRDTPTSRPAVAAQPPPPPAPLPVVAMPAPTLAPPALDDTAPASSASPVPSASSAAPRAMPRPVVPAVEPTAASTAAPPARPGPGF